MVITMTGMMMVVEETATVVEMMALVMAAIPLFSLIESRPLRRIAKVRT